MTLVIKNIEMMNMQGYWNSPALLAALRDVPGRNDKMSIILGSRGGDNALTDFPKFFF